MNATLHFSNDPTVSDVTAVELGLSAETGGSGSFGSGSTIAVYS